MYVDIQINCVEPVMDERKEHLFKKPITEQILRYYRYISKLLIFL